LVHAEHSFQLSDDQGRLAEGEYEIGYVEQQPLSMLAPLELRRANDSGQETLACGADDPLLYNSEQLAVLGWIEAYPILPRADEILHTGPWGVVSLRRHVDPSAWRHRYSVEALDETGEGLALGALHRKPGPGLVALRLRDDGRLASELCTPGRASRDPRKIGRWIAGPLVSEASPAARVKGSLWRLRHLALHFRARRRSQGEGIVLGYLRRQNVAGYGTLYSAIHPVTGDQLVTRTPREAAEWGYLMDGVLGSIGDPL